MSSASPISNLKIIDNEIESWSFCGIYMKHVTDFEICNNRIKNISYAGTIGISVIHGMIIDNNIDNVIATPNSYGISLTRVEVDSLITDPHSSNVIVSRNVVRNIPNWHGLDTHGGQRISFSDNIIEGTKRGIAVGVADGANQIPLFAPLDVNVVNNNLDSQLKDGSSYPDISFTGAPGELGSPKELATGIIQGNIIRGYGDNSNSISGAMYIHNTQSLVISGNTIIEGSPIGINLYHDNYSFACTNNTIVDPWTNSNTVGEAVGINVKSTYNKGLIGGNSLAKNGKIATYILNVGIRITDSATNDIALENNYSEGTTYVYDPGKRIQDILIFSNLGIGTTSPETKLDVEGTVQAHAFDTGDIIFRKDGEKLLHMFEDEQGLYLESLKTGETSRIFMEKDIEEFRAENKSLRQEIEQIKTAIGL